MEDMTTDQHYDTCCMTNLSSSLQLRFHYSRSLEDLDEAVGTGALRRAITSFDKNDIYKEEEAREERHAQRVAAWEKLASDTDAVDFLTAYNETDAANTVYFREPAEYILIFFCEELDQGVRDALGSMFNFVFLTNPSIGGRLFKKLTQRA